MKTFVTTITVCIACAATAGAQRRPDERTPPGPNPRQQHMRQLVGELALNDIQRQEVLRRLRIINRASDTVLIAENKAALAVAEFRGEWDRIDKYKGERRDATCQGRCEELARAYVHETAKLRGAYAGLEEGLQRLADFLNADFSPRQRQLLYRFVEEEMAVVGQRNSAVPRERTAPMADPASPPYPRARLRGQVVPETSTGQKSPPRLRPLETGVVAQRQFVQKRPMKGTVRGILGDRIDKDSVLALVRAVPTRTAAVLMKDLAMAAETALEEPRPDIERR